MKKKIFNDFIIVISIFVLVELFVRKDIVYMAISNALTIWVNTLIPTLFPFFIIADILINYNITIYIPKIFRNICKKIFNISDEMLTIFLLSMISGFPSNARNTRMLYDKKKITLREANHILIFSHFANPAFILITVAIFFFNSKKIGIILLLSHYLSNFILGIIFRSIGGYDKKYNVEYLVKNKFSNIFIMAIKKAVDNILTICGILAIFLMLANIIINTFNIEGYTGVIIKGIFEITIGIEALSKLNIGIIYKVVISSIFLAFGGISVHMQVLSQIIDTDINYNYFFIGRMYQAIISGLISFILCLFLLL